MEGDSFFKNLRDGHKKTQELQELYVYAHPWWFDF
jgi:hypothetical protein